MKAEIKIPVGYRRLKPKELLEKGDRVFLHSQMEWRVTQYVGLKYGSDITGNYIRKIKNPKRKP